MTIYLYSGTPGSGKSLHAAREIYENLKYHKRPVIANFPINEDTQGYENFRYYSNSEITPELLIDYANDFWAVNRFREDRILLVLDECQLLFNSRDWNQRDRMGWLEFFSQHRKYGFLIIFIAQFDRMIDRQIRSLIEYEYVHRRMGNFGIGGKAITLFTAGELFVCVKRFYPLKEKVGTEYFKAWKKHYQLYNSYGTFARQDDGVEGRGQGGPAPIRPHPALRKSLAAGSEKA